MAYNSKYTGEQVEQLLDQVASGNAGGGGGITEEIDPIFSASPAATITEEKIAEWNEKVDKVDGKQLSTEDFTTLLKQKLDGLSNFDDTVLSNALSTLRGDFDALVSGDTTTAIKTFNEVIAFLDGIQDTQDLSGIIASIEQQIAGKMDKVTLATVATSGSYNDLADKPTIPDVSSKQDVLVSGTNIKTINGTSLLGSGDIVISGSGIKKFIFTKNFTFDEDSFEEYKNADEFYYYDANSYIYIELYKLPSDGDRINLLGSTVKTTELITIVVGFEKDGSHYDVVTDEIRVENLVSDMLTDAGLNQQPIEYSITEPIYDGMVLESLYVEPYSTRPLKLDCTSFNGEMYYLCKGSDLCETTTDGETYSVRYYGYYNNQTIICVTVGPTTLNGLLNLIPIGGGEGGGYDDTEIKGQISEIEATIGDINTILESIING